MKKILLILSLVFLPATVLLAQDDDTDDGIENVRDKMAEYIKKRLNLNDAEAKKFTPAFIDYFKEWRKTIKENKGDNLLLRRKVTELQVRHRNKFREIIGENRSNQVFEHQRKFLQELRDLQKNRHRTNPDRNPRRN